MIFRKPPTDKSKLDEVIADALSQLDNVPAYSKEYQEIVIQIEKLTALKTNHSPQKVSPDTMAIVLGNLLGIVFIVGYERSNVMTSAAKNFVMKAAR